jgi:adenosine kinase
MKVVISGSIAYDYLMSFPGKFSDHLIADQLDKISVSFLVDSLRRHRGGVAPNIAYTNALLGGRPKIMATAGQDFEDYRAWLDSHGVDTSGVRVYPDDFCASFFVNTDQVHNQIASFYTGAMANAADLSFAEQGGKVDLAVISPNDPVAMTQYVAECKTLSIPYVYDPSQQIIWLSAEELFQGLDGCRLLTVNEYELRMIQEKTGLDESSILERVDGLIVTFGKRGSRIYADDHTYEIPAVKPEAIIDPTGAGDAFRGGLLRGMQLNMPWDIAGRMGALASAYVLEHSGTQGHGYTPEEFVDRFRLYFDDEGALDVLF